MKILTAFTAGSDIVSRCSKNVTAYIFKDADISVYESKKAQIVSSGFEMINERFGRAYTYCEFLSDNVGVFMYCYPSISELTVVVEENTRYFSYSDTPRNTFVTPQLTQIALEDFGMSYVIRLSDGRFIVIDGGRGFECEADKLYYQLTDSCASGSPIIAAWILSHPHCDHFYCFELFMKKYGDKVTVEKCLFNFPDTDDEYYAEGFARENFPDSGSTASRVNGMLDVICEKDIPVYTPHTGQIYKIGDAVLEFLSAIEDTKHKTPSVNAISLIFRMELAGQVILFTTDGSIGFSMLADKYGDHLKCDILQIPHHGFQSGSPDEEMRGYTLMKPQTCLLPVSDHVAYNYFSAFTKSTGFLFRNIGFEEVIVGTPQRTLSLPYTPPPYARAETMRRFKQGQESCGALTWVFTNLNTADPEDLIFSVLNPAIPIVDVSIDLYFDALAKPVTNIKTQFARCMTAEIDLRDFDKDEKSPFFELESLKAIGIPENSSFSVRFVCSDPVVISHKKHRAAYHSTNVF